MDIAWRWILLCFVLFIVEIAGYMDASGAQSGLVNKPYPPHGEHDGPGMDDDDTPPLALPSLLAQPSTSSATPLAIHTALWSLLLPALLLTRVVIKAMTS